MSAIGPGDIVECVFSGLLPGDVEMEQGVLTVGATYHVSAVDVVQGMPCLELEEFQVVESDGYAPAFQVQHFRRLGPRKGALDHLLAPQDIKVDA